MDRFTKRAVQRLAEELPGDEEVTRGLYAMPPGSISRGMNDRPDMRGAARAARVKRQIEEDRGDSIADRLAPNDTFLTITTRRMFAHAVSKTGKLTDEVTQFSPEDIAEVSAERKRFGGGGTVILTFSDGSQVDFMVRSGQDVEGFRDAWRSTSPSG